MRRGLWAILLGSLLCAINYVGVIAGMLDPPPGYVSAHYIRNLDIPIYLTWAALAKDHWLLPNYNAPWQTEPALFQPMFWLLGRSPLPITVSYYLFQIVLYWIAAYALINAARTFCQTRREMLYAALAMVCTVPLLAFGWVAAKAFGWSAGVMTYLGIGVVQYAYDSADGLMRGGLSNSFTLTFGTAVTLFAFTNLARYVRDGLRRHYLWLVACVFLDAFFHPFEIFLIVAASIWPLWSKGRKREILPLGLAAGAGLLPYVIQSARSAWVRDASDLAQWKMGSPVWVLLVFGIPAMLACWLMLIRFRVDSPEDEVLQSWFVCGALLPMIPAIPVAMHLFDGFAYCVAFLLVRKARQDRLMSKLFSGRPVQMRWALGVWVLISGATLATIYSQVWSDGKAAAPDLFLATVAPRDDVAMISWMRTNLPHGGSNDRLVLAPPKMAPWVAGIPLPSLGSHDLFSISYRKQRSLAISFYEGQDVRHELLDGFGVTYVVAPKSSPVQMTGADLLHEEGSLRLYRIPGEEMKPYPGAANIAGTVPRNALRQLLLHVVAAILPTKK